MEELLAEQNAIYKRIQDGITAFKNGEMVIIMDDEDRENEGDLVMAGIFSNSEKINFMAKYARGLICVAIGQEIATQLDLKPMVEHNSSNHETAFTISIDATKATTGISAYERDMTIRLMCENTTVPSDFVRPGHIFPLIAKDGGVLERTGHTEAGVDLCKLSGLKSVAVICEIMKEDGSMAKRGDKFLLDFALQHRLKILYVSDLVSYRLKYENLVKSTNAQDALLLGHKCTKYTFLDYTDKEHFAYRFGEPNLQNALVKFHTIRSDEEFLSDNKAYVEFIKSAELINKEGGYLIFMDNKPKENFPLKKHFGIGAQILRHLGVDKFRLLSNSAIDNAGDFIALSGFGLSFEKINIQ